VSGAEERAAEEGSPTSGLFVYAPLRAVEAVRAAVEGVAARAGAGSLRIGTGELVSDEDWSVRWREGLRLVRVSPRIAVRPPFAPDDPPPAPPALVIEPGQAFGTGGHASTRLALALLDALPPAELRGVRVLDAGTGSGVLALASLALGARRAVAFDLDAVAVREARANAARNALEAGTRLFAGPIAALRAPAFDGAVANLLRRELLPLLADLSAFVRPGGFVILSGLLASERPEVEAALARAGLAIESEREETDAAGDTWMALLTRRLALRAPRRRGRGASPRRPRRAPSP
jgi:ribosomal protein L11 methyltransferase